MKNEANPKTEGDAPKDRSHEPASVRGLVESHLESAGAGNVVELVRNVAGPEPLRDQPRSIRLFAILFLAGPVLLLLIMEWNFRRLIPIWISFPLTAIAVISYLWKQFRRTNSDHPAAQPTRGQVPGAASSLVSEESPETAEARLLARMLVSEIKLYNPELVAQGVRDGSLPRLLKKEIDRARSIYDSRIPLGTRSLRDHFQDELVRILANGNADLLKT